MSYDKKFTIILVSVLLVFVVAIGSLVHHSNQYTEHKYQLYEMNDGVYAIYYTTHSRVPAHNYEVVTLCCEGNVYTLQGDVFISFTDDKPYAMVKRYNRVNDDDIYVYVPKGTVSYQPSVDIGK